MTADQMIALATAALVLVTLLLVWVTLRGIREQLRVLTFQEYTRRYAEIMETLPFEARRPGGNFDLAGLPSAERERALGAMRKYVNLCSEELYLHEKGRIDDEAWEIWTTGIRDTLRLPCFKQTWDDLCLEYDYYPKFCTFMRSLMEANEHRPSGIVSKSPSDRKPEVWGIGRQHPS